MRAAFKKTQFPAAIGLIDVGHANIIGAAIIAGKNDQRIIVKTMRLKRRHDAPDRTVNRAQHTGINARAMVGKIITDSSIIFFGRLQGRMRAPMRQIEEKRLLFIGGNRFHRLIGEIIGQITVGAKPRAAIKAGRIIQHFPLHLIQDCKFIARINHIRIIDR